MATTVQHNPSTLLPSSIFSTPSFTSTLPIGSARPTSASGFRPRRTSAHRNSRILPRNRHSLPRRPLLSEALDPEDASDDGSLGNLSMENYTIDLAVLARRESGRIGRILTDKQKKEEREGEEDDQNMGLGNKELRSHSEGDVSSDEERSSEGGDFLDGYEIDLGGLGDKPSSVVIESRQEELEEVGSEADGPEDFTMNMEAWMRGKGGVTKAGDLLISSTEQLRAGSAPQLQEATLGFEHENESILEPLGTSTPALQLEKAGQIERQQKPSADRRPLFTRGTTELQQDQAAEEVFERISALQAEAETMREAEERRRSAYDHLSQENKFLRKSHEKFKLAEEENLDLRKEIADLQMKIQERKPDFAATASAMESSPPSEFQEAVIATVEIEAEKEHLDSHKKIETLEAGLKASHAMVRQLREDIAGDKEIHSTKFEGLREDLERLRAEIDTKNERVADLEQDADTHMDIVKHRDQLIARLTTEAQTAQTKIEHAEQEARESRRLTQSIEEENDRLTSQISRQAEEMAGIDGILQYKARELQTAYSTITSLKDALQGALSDKGATAMSDETSHQNALKALKEEHSNALAALNHKFARQLQLFKQDRDTQASKHAAELAKARKASSANTAMETELRSAIRVLSSKLEKSNQATREAQAKLEKAQTDLKHVHQTLQSTRQEHELANAEMDAQFVQTMDAREREWRARVALLFREREKMGKALMMGWGREDMGKGVKGLDGGQAYRYRFLKR